MTFSLFIRECGRLRFNPYLSIGGYELCVDRNGVAIHMPRRSCGFIRGAGFWHRRVTGCPDCELTGNCEEHPFG